MPQNPIQGARLKEFISLWLWFTYNGTTHVCKNDLKKSAPKFGRTFFGSENSFTPRVCDQKWHFCAQNRGALPYIYIYIYGSGLVCRRKFCHFWHFFPSFIVRNGKFEMLQICPISPFTFLTKIAQKRPGTAVPSNFPKNETLGLQSQAFWVILIEIFSLCLRSLFCWASLSPNLSFYLSLSLSASLSLFLFLDLVID